MRLCRSCFDCFYRFCHASFHRNFTRDKAFNTLCVPAGQRAQITLQDGTTVWLMLNPRWTYPSRFAGKERKVTLMGEAYFDVAKTPRKPFLVSTQNIQLKVLGTLFNVRDYPNAESFEGLAFEGSVEIDRGSKGALMLKPGEEVTMQEGNMSGSAIVNPNYFLWKDGIYSFDNESLLEILQKLQLYYDVPLKWKILKYLMCVIPANSVRATALTRFYISSEKFIIST